MHRSHRTEVLAPAGGWSALEAAIASGADAVYFGLQEFNARFRAENFSLEELPRVALRLHEAGMRGYVTFNTLVFSGELERARDELLAIAESGIDAIIVQDLGIAWLARALAPGLEIHASTQMTLTEHRAIEEVADLGISRVILARELSIGEISKIASKSPLPVEVFVHGALCVAYSGQCLTSEALGGRSANRGQCAQACRLPYDLVSDGKVLDLGDKAYLLSPQDLAAPDRVKDLIDAGVISLKIEGRLKDEHYVTATTSTYVRARDEAIHKRTYRPGEIESHDLEMTFSRGFTKGFLDGVNHQDLVRARYSKSRGIQVGVVECVRKHWIEIQLTTSIDLATEGGPLVPGVGIVLDEGRLEGKERGGRLYATEAVGPSRVRVKFGKDGPDLNAVPRGTPVFKTDDPRVRRRLRSRWNPNRARAPVPVNFELSGVPGGPLTLRGQVTNGAANSVVWQGPLEEPRTSTLTLETARDQLGRLGTTGYSLGQVSFDFPHPVMIPRSVLNQLRREMVEKLLECEVKVSIQETNPQALEVIRRQIASSHPASSHPAQSERGVELTVLARTLPQVEAALGFTCPDTGRTVDRIYCDFEDVRRYREATDLVRGSNRRTQIGLATLRIVKPGEYGLLDQVSRLEPDVILVRNLAALNHYRNNGVESQLMADFSMNVANELTASWLIGRGIHRLVPAHDLTIDQVEDMVGRVDPGVFEIIVHHHMPMFHMEHCVFAAFMSEGKDWRDCGRPCDRHAIELRDRVGASHPVLVDVGCRNTVYNAHVQSAAEYISRLRARGVGGFRIELLRQSTKEIKDMLGIYARVIEGMDSGGTTFLKLKASNRFGITRGTLERGRHKEPLFPGEKSAYSS